MDLMMSHQVDATLDEEPSGDEEEENEETSKPNETESTVNDSRVPKKLAASLSTISNNKSHSTGKDS